MATSSDPERAGHLPDLRTNPIPDPNPTPPHGSSLEPPGATEGGEYPDEALPGAIVRQAHLSFTGPLPHPRLLSEYDRVLPGLAERIVLMAEQEGTHRRRVESRLVRLSEWGVWGAVLLAGISIVGGLLLLWNGRTLEGLTPLVLAIVALVTVFITGRRSPPADTTDAEDRE